MEIERKFLIDRLPPELDEGRGTPIRQGYLAVGEGPEVRLRDAGGRCTETVKIGRGLVRRELEVELEREQLGALWPATEGRRLEKTRHRLEVGGRTAEVDVYRGALAGLVVVEVEFGSEAEAAAFVPPSWFGVEVTGDERYANARLAVSGLPSAP
jgi:adenylate cyclase